MNRAGSRRVARRAGQRGSVMVEALVSIVVTSLAMMASAALAINAAKVNQTGRYRTQAVALVNDIAERIDANFTASGAGAYALAVDYTPPQEGVVLADCGATLCSPAQHAAADLAAWRNRVVNTLPQASAQLIYTAAAGATPARYAITVTWIERSLGHGGTARTNGGDVTAAAESFTYTATKAVSPR
jgi:type IV pilus assembly protein PilV